MPINRSNPDRWKEDINQSVDLYNSWFMEFAPKAFRKTRLSTATRVEEALNATTNLTNISSELLRNHPEVLPILRMSTCPPIARDRLIGLAGISKTLVTSMEDTVNPRIPPRIPTERLESDLERICYIIQKMADPDIFTWLNRAVPASDIEVSRAATIVADRLCGAVSDPIIRNAQEKRQLNAIGKWLKHNGYRHIEGTKFNEMPPGTYSFRTNVPVSISGSGDTAKVNIPVDVVIMPLKSASGDLPLLIEAKSAGDFTNVNKRRKEEAQKMAQLKITYGNEVRFGLFLCGYFDSGYLGYEAAEGIDWVWEHRIDDLALFGL
ncbi:XamI family restriction endonuclease [Desulfovibrio sp. 86]|uniref:Type-2 restriction enzyme SalI n=1 Tax=uncultured Desulfovibrio sp. TaxID=167968 RepID=A0A212L7Q3_9BACT|nr:XamI family restriction endonuclease [Desulfovibrio sp. 86]SCM73581.1 Type-2 restriction enzyme SalI [uncultured Desulfovibrio sp.]VZH34292.1 Type-2 restriction enzyme SalI [Desulfovibrio sp. 86]